MSGEGSAHFGFEVRTIPNGGDEDFGLTQVLGEGAIETQGGIKIQILGAWLRDLNRTVELPGICGEWMIAILEDEVRPVFALDGAGADEISPFDLQGFVSPFEG